MGLHRKVRKHETIYLQRGDEVIAIHCNEFFQGDFGGTKVDLIIDAPQSWQITHQEKGKSPHAHNPRHSQEKVLSQYEFTETPEEAAARKIRQEAIYNHKSDTPY